MRRVETYFDFISPYAYFGWRNVRRLLEARDDVLVPRPVVFAALLNHHGQLGPAEIPAKRVWTFKHVARYAALNRVPLRGPATHPFRSLTALRICSLPAEAEKVLLRIDALFDAIWAEGIDGGSDDALAAALDARDLDGAALVSAANEDDAKARLKATTAEGIARGVFGVPTYIVEEELFWGNDSLPYVELYLDDADPLDPNLTERILSRPRGADRRPR